MLDKTAKRVAPLLFGGLVAMAAAPASGAVVYSNAFDGPSPLDDFSLSGAPTLPAVVGDDGNPSPSLRLQDTTTNTTPPIASVTFDHFAEFDTSQPDQQEIRFAFDFKVDSMENAAVSSAANPRVILRANGTDWLVFGFGRRGGYNGYPGAATRNLLYATNTRGTRVPTATDTDAAVAIGYPVGNATGAFDDGFDFGPYDTATADHNGTGGWIRFVVTYLDGDGLAEVVATNLLTDDQVSFSYSVAPTSFSNTEASYVSVDGGSAGLADFAFDNLEVSVVPEPASLGLVLAGLGMIGLRSGRRA